MSLANGGKIPPGVDPTTFMLGLPALQAPPGANTTMTTDSPDQVWYLVVAITCIAIPAIFLILRIYTKWAIMGMLELADYFIFLSFPLLVVEIVMGYYMVKYGAGVHQWQVTYGQLFKQLYWMNTAEVIYCPLSFLVKMAILLQYLRLFAPSRQMNKTMFYGAWIAICLNFIFYTVFMFWTLFYCKPRAMIWDKFIQGGKCHDHSPIVISQGAFNMASDVFILLLPTRSLWQLQIPLARKVVITLLFATGLLACAASVMRIVFTTKIAPVYTMSDVSHNGLFIGLWTEAEVALAFIVACSLSFPRLFQAKREKLSRAFSIVSSPFTTMRSINSSRRSTTLKSRTTETMAASRISQQIHMPEPKRPVFYEDRELHAERAYGGHSNPRDMYPLPSGLDGSQASSNYSQSNYSKRSSMVHDEEAQASFAPLKWSFNRYLSPYDLPNSQNHGDRLSLARSVSLSHTVSRSQSRASRRVPVERANTTAVLEESPDSDEEYRLTPEEIFVLQQFQFGRLDDSIDIERTADRALGPVSP